MFYETIEDKKKIFYDSLYTENGEIRIYFSKHSSSNDIPRFYFSFYEQNCLIAYIYFYLIGKKSQSELIGLYVDEKKRNQGYAKLLIATWISFCLNHSIEIIQTTERQRKPFILYLLKMFFFDLRDECEKKRDRRGIDICKMEDSFLKYLHFHDINQEIGFRNSHIMKEDNYQILSEVDLLKKQVQVLDTVLLHKSYSSYDNEKSYMKAKTILGK